MKCRGEVLKNLIYSTSYRVQVLFEIKGWDKDGGQSDIRRIHL
jgi:hypothetical protein